MFCEEKVDPCDLLAAQEFVPFRRFDHVKLIYLDVGEPRHDCVPRADIQPHLAARTSQCDQLLPDERGTHLGP